MIWNRLPVRGLRDAGLLTLTVRNNNPAPAPHRRPLRVRPHSRRAPPRSSGSRCGQAIRSRGQCARPDRGWRRLNISRRPLRSIRCSRSTLHRRRIPHRCRLAGRSFRCRLMRMRTARPGRRAVTRPCSRSAQQAAEAVDMAAATMTKKMRTSMKAAEADAGSKRSSR